MASRATTKSMRSNRAGNKLERELYVELLRAGLVIYPTWGLMRDLARELCAGHVPDALVPGLQRHTALLVHGCWWHGCPTHYHPPRTRRAYWDDKIERNRARDARVARKIRRRGLSVVTLWEHDLRPRPSAKLQSVIDELLRRQGTSTCPSK